MRRRFPQHVLGADEMALLEHDAGYVKPEQCIEAALERAAALGASVQLNTPVTSIDATGDGVEVIAGGRRWTARRAIVAAGPWNSTLGVPGLDLHLNVVRQSQAWFRALQPELHHPSVAPIFVRNVGHGELPGTDFAYGFPSLDGETVKVKVLPLPGALSSAILPFIS